jgi:hypothetical protein
LERYGIPHSFVKVIPFIHELIPDINIDGPVVVMGSTALTKIAQRKEWEPGSFYNDNFSFEVWEVAYGENILNHGAVITQFQNVAPYGGEVFIRPCEDTKSFSGCVMDWVEFVKWQNNVVNLNDDLAPLKPETMVMFAPLKEIYAEYRFFIVDGSVITGSLYKRGGVIVHDTNIDDRILEFTQNMVDLWQPARAFVLDVADTPNGLKVIEINNINSAGYYACNISRIVQAMENMGYE